MVHCRSKERSRGSGGGGTCRDTWAPTPNISIRPSAAATTSAPRSPCSHDAAPKHGGVHPPAAMTSLAYDSHKQRYWHLSRNKAENMQGTECNIQNDKTSLNHETALHQLLIFTLEKRFIWQTYWFTALQSQLLHVLSLTEFFAFVFYDSTHMYQWICESYLYRSFCQSILSFLGESEMSHINGVRREIRPAPPQHRVIMLQIKITYCSFKRARPVQRRKGHSIFE